jgi:hypothetical protein
VGTSLPAGAIPQAFDVPHLEREPTRRLSAAGLTPAVDVTPLQCKAKRAELYEAKLLSLGAIMRLAHFRVRTLMIAVGVVALLVWGAMMASRSYDYYRRAREYGENERGWREIAARGRWDATFASECTEYFAQLAGKYRRSMWRPWTAVAPDPHAPGFDQWLEQERRAKEALRGADEHSP